VTATISLVAGSQPEGMIAAAARMTASITTVEAQNAAQRAALARLASGWRGDAACQLTRKVSKCPFRCGIDG
jgi:uncharacterized protein YukE